MLAKGNAATSEDVAASTEEQLASMEEISSSAQFFIKLDFFKLVPYLDSIGIRFFCMATTY